MHKHKVAREFRPGPFRHPVGPPQDQNRAAHGSIEVVQECSCGALRLVNRNGLHEESGYWR